MGLTTQTFDIITRIAIGNGALVYRAVEKNSLRQVALKLLTQDGEIDHRLDLDALFADAPRLKSIYGAHVCQLLDAYADEDGPVLVYEFANGLNGAEFPRERKLDATQALDVAAQLISALRSGERQRMPHGDLKPSNIIFVDLPDGRPFTFVLDWGVAAYRSMLHNDSLYYLAPERLRGGPPSHAADLFAAGAVLFYLYTGKVLVAGGTYEQVAAAWQKVKPVVLAELRPDLSSRLVQWVCGLMELDPARRPASAVEASAALAALNPPPPAPTPESIRPRPVSASSTRLPVPSSAPSSVIKPPPHRSGIRPAPAVTAPVPRPRPPAAPKKKSALPAVLFGMLTAAALAAGGWYVYTHRTKSASAEAPEVASSTPSRTPSPSVGPPVATPPPRPLPGNEPKAAAPKPGGSKPPGKPAPAKAAPAPPQAQSKPASVEPFIAVDDIQGKAGQKIDGLNGGTGWAGPWQGSAAQFDSHPLAYEGLPKSGGSIKIDPTDQEVILSRVVGSSGRFVPDLEKGGHWYFGALVLHKSTIHSMGGQLKINPFDPNDPTSLMEIVVTDVGDSLKISLHKDQKPLELKDDGKPICLVLRVVAKFSKYENFDLTGSLFVNPDLAKDPPLRPDLECTVTAQPLPKQMGVLFRKRGPAEILIDDVRYAHHWNRVAFRTDRKSAE